MTLRVGDKVMILQGVAEGKIGVIDYASDGKDYYGILIAGEGSNPSGYYGYELKKVESEIEIGCVK